MPHSVADPFDDPVAKHVRGILTQCGALPAGEEDCLNSIARSSTWFSLRGGELLCRQGEPSSSAYIVINGLLAATVRDATGEEVLVGRIGPGELVGEVGALLDDPRSATVHAIRTSELLAISRESLEILAAEHASIFKWLYGTLSKRLANSQAGRRPFAPDRTFCLLPLSDVSDPMSFAQAFTEELCAFGGTFLATRPELANSTSDKLAALETQHDYVVYLADQRDTKWSRLCLSQADKVLLIAEGQARPEAPVIYQTLRDKPVRTDLLLLWPAQVIPVGRTSIWLELTHPDDYFHVRHSTDLRRAVKLLTGRGVGLVFSGGGARGLAHLGVARAMSEAGITADVICGTSVGALIGAALARDISVDAIRAEMREFARKHPLREVVLPRYSLLSGRNLYQSLRRWFQELCIEDMPIRFACVTTNMSRCAVETHRRGKVEKAIAASCSVPGIFPPALLSGQVHVDGGILNNLPAKLARRLGAGYVIGVDAGVRPMSANTHLRSAEGQPVPNILELLMQVGTMSDATRGARADEQADMLLLPDVQELGILNWRAHDWAITRGYDCAVAQIGAIKAGIADLQQWSKASDLSASAFFG